MFNLFNNYRVGIAWPLRPVSPWRPSLTSLSAKIWRFLASQNYTWSRMRIEARGVQSLAHTGFSCTGNKATVVPFNKLRGLPTETRTNFTITNKIRLLITGDVNGLTVVPSSNARLGDTLGHSQDNRSKTKNNSRYDQLLFYTYKCISQH